MDQDLLNSEADNNIKNTQQETIKTVVSMMPHVFTYYEIFVFTNKNNVYKLQNKPFKGPKVLTELEYEIDEKPIYIGGTNDYKGFYFLGYQNGKLAKINLSCFKTEFNRKKLKTAFNTDSPLLFIEINEQDIDVIFISNLNKVVLTNTSNINPVDSRSSKGNHVMKSKHGSYVTHIKKPSQVNFQDLEYYRKEPNVVGFYLKPGDALVV